MFLCLLGICQGVQAVSSLQWTKVDTPSAGNFSAITGSSKSANILYAAVENNGVFLSKDFGEHWQPIYGPNLIGQLIHLDDKLYVLEVNYSEHRGMSVHSYDEVTGEWQQINTGLPSISINSITAYKNTLYAACDNGIFKLAPDNYWTFLTSLPVDPNSNVLQYDMAVFLLDDNTMLAVSSKLAIYKSIDGGKNWTQKTPNHKSIMLPSVIGFEKIDDAIYFANSEDGLLKSDDQGENWRVVHGEFEKYKLNAITTNKQGHIYIGTSISSDSTFKFDGGVYESTDGGNSWKKLAAGFTGNIIVNSIFAVDNNVFAGLTNNIFKYNKNENRWLQSGDGIKYMDIDAVYPLFNGDLVALTSVPRDSVYYFNSTTKQWYYHELSGSGFSGIYKKNNVVINSHGEFFIGSSNKLYKIIDQGAALSEIKLPIAERDNISTMLIEHDTIYVALYNSSDQATTKILASSDNGVTWKNIFNHRLGLFRLMTKSNDQMYFAFPDEKNNIISTISLSKNNPPAFISGLPEYIGRITQFATNRDTTGANRLYASTMGYRYFSKTGSLYVSADDGINWKDLHANLPKSISITDFLVQGDLIIITSEQGVYLSEDSGESWKNISQGLPEHPLIRNIQTYDGHTYYVSVFGKGIYQLIK